MKRAQAWARSPEPELERRRMESIRATRRAWNHFLSLANKRDRAALAKDVPAREALDAEIADVDRQLDQLERQLAGFDRQCNQERETA